MICDRTRIAAVLRLLLAVAMPLAPLTANAAPAREALVIGNGTYTALPPLPGCLLSAHVVAAALQALGFNVVERDDATSGGTDAAIGEFAKRLAASPGAAAVVYLCAYAVSYNDRPFLLPVTANIARPADVLTQGLLGKSLVDTLLRGGAGAALLALDVVPVPGGAAAVGLDTILRADLPGALGAIVASQAQASAAPTPLAAALVANLKGPDVQVAPLLATVQQQLATGKVATITALRVPGGPAYLAGEPAPVAAAAPPPAPAPPPLAAPAPASMPADEQMTEADRRRVQAALVRLGYYAGQVDGVFGADTRAAIRRYQHELGTAMTGRLTVEQASKLVGGR